MEEIVFTSELGKENIQRLLKKNLIRKISSGIYTSNFKDSIENITKRKWLDIVGARYSNSILSHITAKQLKPTEKGDVFITSILSSRNDTSIPGLIIHIINGRKALDSDLKLPYNIYVSSEYRWMLECMQTRRNDEAAEKEVEKNLENILIRDGKSGINDYREKLREIAEQLNFDKEFSKINRKISALLSTHPVSALRSNTAIALAKGSPYDEEREKKFCILFDALNSYHFEERRSLCNKVEQYNIFAFFESYFSNYIEGTEFELGEAKKIIETGIAPSGQKEKDGHDIISTYKIVSNLSEMRNVPHTADDFISILKHRHGMLMKERPEVCPGEFKKVSNRAGMTVFVHPQKVVGTLKESFKYYALLKDPMAKAIFVSYVVSETHPFNDGNGRMSRIMMNAELEAAGLSRIIIPNVYRDDYILSLRRLSGQSDPDAYIRSMDKLQFFSSKINSPDEKEVEMYLRSCNAFTDPTKAYLKLEKNVKDDADIVFEDAFHRSDWEMLVSMSQKGYIPSDNILVKIGYEKMDPSQKSAIDCIFNIEQLKSQVKDYVKNKNNSLDI
jgi:prophage maintenance system killer protein